MPISEKLTYLNNTKQLIKENLNKFGSNITENNTFRSYSNVINDIYDKLPKVSGNGSDFSLGNAQNGKLDSFGMDGNTEQTTYSGKNLCSSAELQSAANIRFYIDKKIEKTLTISFTTNERLNTNSLYLSATDTLATTITADANTKATATFTLSDEQYSAIQNATNPYFLLFKSGANFTIPTDAQIENGSNATDYEPYVGGMPSPNPDYPQQIEVVTGDNTINIHGKNLNKTTIIANLTSGNEKWTGTRLDNVNWENGKTYYIKAFLEKQSNEEVQITNYGYKNIDSKRDTIVFNGNIPYVRVGANTLNSNITNEEVKIMVSTETFTDFEPYQSQDYEIDLLDYELCEIEDYKDVIFKNNQLSSYYDSTLDEDSWYIKKEIGKVVLDGSEEWSFTSNGNAWYIFQWAQNNNAEIPATSDTLSNSLSNYFVNITRNQVGTSINGIGIASSGALNIKHKDYITDTSTNDFKTWLSTHNTEVYYVLATPTYEKITDETLISQLESIETFTGLNYFSVSNENNVLPTLYVSRLKELGKLE